MKKLVFMLALSLLLTGCINDGESKDTAKVTKPLSEKEAVHAQEEAGSEISESSEGPAAEVKRKKGSEQAPIVKEPAVSPKNKETTSTKSEKLKYLNKLADVKAGISEFDKQLKSGTQVEMGQAYAEIFKRWDQEMNNIYGALKNQLSVSEMNKLRAEQRNWLIYRDKAAKEESLKYEGGTMASLEYVATQVRLTEERCYELVEAYMY